MSAKRLSTFQIGSPVRPGHGLRIAVTRRPPRGIPRNRWKRDGYFDVWLPTLAPSAGLIRRYRRGYHESAALRRAFLDAYERELQGTEARQAVALLAELARRIRISIGCYCSDESLCHRSRLAKVIRRA
jgi:uncharacterized protein YeaO (DUF488 family)